MHVHQRAHQYFELCDFVVGVVVEMRASWYHTPELIILVDVLDHFVVRQVKLADIVPRIPTIAQLAGVGHDFCLQAPVIVSSEEILEKHRRIHP